MTRTSGAVTRDYCTYFDAAYLDRGLALYRSMKAHCAPFRLFLLCLDDACFEALSAMRLPEVTLIRMADFEAADPALASAKKDRGRIEYYFTCTPCLPLHVFRAYPDVALLTYLDADLFFFSDPAPVFEEIGTRPIAIIPHRHPPKNRHLETRYGLYNVGWLTFARDDEAFACLAWWRERCLEWCSVREDSGRYADQKYLDRWPSLFTNVAELAHKGANLAPWNVGNYRIRARGGRVFVDGDPLVFFHFHGFGRVRKRIYDTNLALYRARGKRAVIRHVYVPYMRALAAARPEGAGRPSAPAPPARPAPLWARLFSKTAGASRVARRLALGQYFIGPE